MNAPQRQLIVVVDDDPASLYVKGRILKGAGFHVVEASTGADALELVEARSPALVVLDIQLPDVSGLEVCRIIKSRDLPALVLQTSATFVQGGDRVIGLEGGADAYLVEPLEPEELIATVRALLRARMAENELRRLNDTLEQRVAERTRQLNDAHERLLVEIEERRRAEESLLQAQKLEAVGQLTGGIAHDFNNLLTVIYGGLDTVRRRLPEGDERIDKALSHAMTGARRGAALTRHLLAFARRQSLDPKPLDVNKFMRGMRELLVRTLGEKITIDLALDPAVSIIEVDANQLENALLNIAFNARDAMPNGGTLAIETASAVVEDAAARGHIEVTPGSYALIAVGDSGTGMAPDIVERVFEPFFTTKGLGEGTGLGLSQVYGFVKQSGGHVSLYSRPGFGTTIKLYLPASSASLPEEKEEDLVQLAPKRTVGNEIVLVVEDDDAVRSYSADAVSDLGYRVIEARNGKQALDCLAKHPDVALLFTDIGLPGGMTGLELAYEARRTLPAIRILFTTGYGARAGDLPSTVKPSHMIQKPFTYAQLAEKLRFVLTHPPAE